MNSAPTCSPVSAESDDDDLDGKLSPACSDNVDYPLQANNSNIANGRMSENGDCEKVADSDSDDGCGDGLADDNPVHRLIIHCQQTSSVALDLSRHGLQLLGQRLLKLSHLQVILLYMFC